MNSLDTNRINVNSPYKVWAEIPNVTPEGKPTQDYISIIVPRTHPQLQTIIDLFNEEVAMFCANKPQG